MSEEQAAYFLQRYREMDTEELIELRAGGLSEIALGCADIVLSERGVKPEMQRAGASSDEDGTAATGEQGARKLWNSGLVRVTQFSYMLFAWSPLQLALKRTDVQIGALWMGLLAVGTAYAGYSLAKAMTREICADERTTYPQKRGRVFFLLGAGVAFWFLAIGLVSALTSR